MFSLRCSCALILMLSLMTARGAEFVIATEGQAAGGVIVGAKASERTQAAAKELAAMLKAISGGEFEVKTGDGSEGIVVGTVADFPKLSKDERLTDKAITARENYLLRSEPRRLVLLGNTERGVEDAVWHLLHRLGVRQYFPGKHWEIIPKQANLSIEMSSFQSPSYHSRSIWYGFGSLPERKADYETWCRRNRATKGIELLSGHAYGKIESSNKAAFAQHPEYLALVKGKRAVDDSNAKFCISNPELRALVVKTCLAQLDADPSLDSVSVEPSDGGGWCECAECAKIGSVSDQALLLASEVGRAVEAKYPGKLVGMYAYNEHSPVPATNGAANVVVSIAAGFIKGGATMDELIDGWSQRVPALGIREYLSVFTWDHDMPGAARGAQIDYLQETIPHFHEKAARYYSAESSDNWGCNGLGYYIASRLLWDVGEAGNIEAMFDDFLDQCFGPAKLPMSRFYNLINRSRPLASDDLIGRMYRHLKDASDLEISDDIRARIDDLILYTKACDLRFDYESASGEERQQAFEAMLRHAWRIRALGMVHTHAIWRDAPRRDKAVKMPEDLASWKSDEPYTREDLDGFAEQGIETHEIATFEPATFSSDLVPAAKLKLSSGKPGTFGDLQRGTGNYWTWIEKAPAEIRLQVTAGLVYQNQGPAKVRLFPAGETQGESVSEGEAAPDKQPHEIVLKTTFTGLHRIEVEDHRAGSKVAFPEGLPVTFHATADQTATLGGRHDLYFFVPAGTAVVGGYAEGEGRLVDASGTKVHEFTRKPGYFSIPVAPGQDGRLWKFEFTNGKRVLLTVPPQMARSADGLLLPKEVVK